MSIARAIRPEKSDGVRKLHLKIPDENNSCYRRIHANSFMQIVLQDWTTDKYARAFPVAFFDLHLSIKH